MSESIAEMVVPGTYIEVRAEGLIGVGGIVTGNIGIVGTAARGPVGRVVTVGSYAEALEAFGLPDDLGSPRKTGAPLSLTRTLQQAFEGGARVVHAVRIANGDPVADSAEVQAAGGGHGFTMTAKGALDADGAPIAGSSGTWGHDLLVSLAPDPVTSGSFRLALTHRRRTQVVEGTSVEQLHDALADSPWVDVGTLENGGAKPEPIPAATALSGGADGADAGVADAADGLEALEQQQVNLLLVAGFGADQVGNAVQGHLQRTLSEGRERIAVLGARASGAATDAAPVVSDADGLENDRVVLVAPGIRTAEGALPPSYLAAVVAGRLSTLAPHVSLTNKALPVTPDVRYSTGVVSTLLGKQVLVVRHQVRVAGGPRDHDLGPAVRPDQRAAHRRLRQGRGAAGLGPLHRPAQQRPGAGGAAVDARRVPLPDGPRRDAHRLRPLRHRHPGAGDRRRLPGRHEPQADLLHRLHPRDHEPRVSQEPRCPTPASTPAWTAPSCVAVDDPESPEGAAATAWSTPSRSRRWGGPPRSTSRSRRRCGPFHELGQRYADRAPRRQRQRHRHDRPGARERRAAASSCSATARAGTRPAAAFVSPAFNLSLMLENPARPGQRATIRSTASKLDGWSLPDARGRLRDGAGELQGAVDQRPGRGAGVTSVASERRGATLSAEDLLAGAGLQHRVVVPTELLGPADRPATEVVLRPLVLADVMRLHRAAGEDGELASALMVQQSLVEPALSVAEVHRLPAGLVEFLLAQVNRVSGLSLGGDDLTEAVQAPLARACFVLSREFGWTPDRCAELTVGQVLLYLEMLGRGERP